MMCVDEVFKLSISKISEALLVKTNKSGNENMVKVYLRV